MAKLTYRELLKLEKRQKRMPKKVFDCQFGSLLKYCLYVYDILYQKELHPPYENIGLLHYDLLRKYSINSLQSYSYMLKVLERIGIITNRNRKHWFDSSHFLINTDKLLQTIEICWELEMLHYSTTINCFDSAKSVSFFDKCIGFLSLPLNTCKTNMQNEKLLSENWNLEINELRDFLNTSTHDYYMNVLSNEYAKNDSKIIHKLTPLLKEIDSITEDKISPFFFQTNIDLSCEEQSFLKAYYLNRFSVNKYWKLLDSYIRQANSFLPKEYHIKAYPSPRLKKLNQKRGYCLSVTLRQNNKLCTASKEERELLNQKDGFNGNFDIHSTIHSLARMINFGIFDVDWSLKNELVALGFDRKKEIDPFDLLYRVFFEPDFNTCWKNYKDRAKWFAQEPPLNKERLSFVYDYVHQVCGPTYEHSTYIFLIESLLELRVINNVLKKGCSIRNVYDCFFFKTSEISEEEIKDIIQEEALATYQLFKKKDN